MSAGQEQRQFAAMAKSCRRDGVIEAHMSPSLAAAESAYERFVAYLKAAKIGHRATRLRVTFPSGSQAVFQC